MGYCMHMREAVFAFKRNSEHRAVLAIKALADQETIEDASGKHYSWVNTKSFLNAITIGEAMRAWRWSWDGQDIWFEGEKLGDDFILFQAIAPYVEKDCYIEVAGEDGFIWRWVFDGNAVKEVAGKLVFG